MTTSKGSAKSTELVDLSPLDHLSDYGKILEFFAQQGVDVTDLEQDGIRALRILDKASLIGVPFLIVQWRFNEGDFGTFVSAEVVLPDHSLGVINDGSTGIREQLENITAARQASGHKTPYAGRMVAGGISVSNYTYFDEKLNKDVPASTYYLQFA